MVDPPREHFAPLNASQIKAIRAALANRFTLIQGPPGTGKTTVIAALALSFVKAGHTPVLVCAQSNVATDFATKRIAQTGVHVVRVLSSTREQVASDVDSFTTKRLAATQYGEDFTTRLASGSPEDHKRVTQMEIKVVNDSDVVCTTCTSAGGARLGRGSYPVVIFDESGQCVDPDLLIPLVHRAEQAVLVGDHCQLGPVILSHRCQRARYDLPLMQRLIVLGIHPIVLRMQYRMHPALSEFPSEAFYKHLVKDGITAAHRRWRGGDFVTWPNPEVPMFYWNVLSEEEYYESGLSYVNRHEIGCIAVLLDAMWRRGISASDIGVITPYAGQQALLIDSLPTLCRIDDPKFFEEIEIASVDAFQGREKNFIILSNVRANDVHDIGFLKDQRRLCVSLTRARYGMIVIGCARTFARNRLWCKYIEHCKSKGVFVEGSLTDLQPSQFEPLVGEGDRDETESETYGAIA
jgi:regulator of nonsense transcripts 1